MGVQGLRISKVCDFDWNSHYKKILILISTAENEKQIETFWETQYEGSHVVNNNSTQNSSKILNMTVEV